MTPWLDEMQRYLSAGGLVMIPLLLLALLLWFLIGVRWSRLRRGIRGRTATWLAERDRDPQVEGDGVLPTAWRRAATARRDAPHEPRDAVRVAVDEMSAELRRYRQTIRTITAVAPLLGLLGTVNGMIGTFTALTIQGMAGDSGVAGGISEALVSTQMGLFVAIPGLFVGRLLDQREQVLRDDLDRLGATLVRLSGTDAGRVRGAATT